MMSRSRSGISPVVATVILVAIAIVIAIAVAFWATGLVGIFTRFEKLEITSAYQDPNNPGNIIVRVRNTGSSPTAIAEVIINGISVKQVDNPDTCKLNVGDTLQVTITTSGLQGGVTYEVMLKSTGGKQYPTAILANIGNKPGTPEITGVSCERQAGGGGAGGGGAGGGTQTTTTTPTTTTTSSSGT
jgi:flagellin-like protein